MSVGKTTLVNRLKELKQFKDYEFATERSKYLNDLGIPLNTDSTLKGQTVFLSCINSAQRSAKNTVCPFNVESVFNGMPKSLKYLLRSVAKL